MKSFKSIEQIKELVLSKSESLEKFITDCFELPKCPIPSDFEELYNSKFLPEIKNPESTLGIKDFLTVLDDFALHANSNAMKTACSIFSVYVRSRNNRQKDFKPKKRNFAKKPAFIEDK